MPLLNGEPYVRHKPASNLKPNDDVFLCKPTGEVFSDYEQFFEQTILCNSLIWTCATTGKEGLTFQEALDSERQSVQSKLPEFPPELQSALLYLASLTHRGRLNDVTDDVYQFARNRYFVGEVVVVAKPGGQRRSCTVVKVAFPDDDAASPDGKIRKSMGTTAYGTGVNLDASSYLYTVRDVDNEKHVSVCSASSIRRRKANIITRDRLKMFLKRYCHSQGPGIWVVKPKYSKRHKLSSVKFGQLFVGRPPTFPRSEGKKRPSAAARNDEDEDDEEPVAVNNDCDNIIEERNEHRLNESSEMEEVDVSEHVIAIKKAMAEKLDLAKKLKQEREERAREEQRLRDKELAEKAEIIRQAEEEKERRRLEREALKEMRRAEEEYKREWKKPRDDLECDDLQPLPKAEEIQCLPLSELFGDVVMILESLTAFSSIFELEFTSTITFETLQQCLCDMDVNNVYSDILRQLLSTIFRLQDDPDVAFVSFDSVDSMTSSERSDISSVASWWPLFTSDTSDGLLLRKLQLDNYTVSEVLRLYLESSGSAKSTTPQSHARARAGFVLNDDPAVDFYREHRDILISLSQKSVFDLSPYDKLQLLSVLIHQLLSCFTVSRDFFDENLEKLKQNLRSLRDHKAMVVRREKEKAAFLTKANEPQDVPETSINANSGASDGTTPEPPVVTVQPAAPVASVPRKKRVLKDKDIEKMFSSMEEIAWSELSETDMQSFADWMTKTETEIRKQIKTLQLSIGTHPLGLDRRCRRYWIFHCLPGLFVEAEAGVQADDILALQSQAANQSTNVIENSSGNFASNMNTESSVVKKELNADEYFDDRLAAKSDTNGTVSDISTKNSNPPVNGEVKTTVKENKDDVKMDAVLLANGVLSMKEDSVENVEDENKHNPNEEYKSNSLPAVESSEHCLNKCRWFVYRRSEDIDSLMAALNPRGFRESALKKVLKDRKSRIVEAIHEGNSMTIVSSAPSVSADSTRKESTDIGKLETSLREMLLDLEERVDIGCLGKLKVPCRESWRLAVQNRSSNKRPSKRSDTANEKTEVDDDGKETEEERNKMVVKELSKVLIEIEQMIEGKFLDKPLRCSEETQALLLKFAAEVEDDQSANVPYAPTTGIECWEMHVEASTSLSQLFLCLSILETSVAWDRSVLNARCMVCKSKDDDEHMLLCDECNRGFHMYCLRPKINNIPAGNWYCTTCRPKPVIAKPPRKPTAPKKWDYEDDEIESLAMYCGGDILSSDDDLSSLTDDSNSSSYDNPRSCFNNLPPELVSETDSFSVEGSQHSQQATGEGRKRKLSPLVNGFSKKPRLITTSRNKSSTPNTGSKNDSKLSAKKKGRPKKLSTSLPAKASVVMKSQTNSTQRAALAYSSDEFCSTLTLKKTSGSRASLDTAVDSSRSVKQSAKTGKTARPSLDSGLLSPRATRMKKDITSKSFQDDEVRRKYAPVKSSFRAVESGLKAYENLLGELMLSDDAWPFLRPVKLRDAPDYFDIIKKPMDFMTMRTKMYRFEYNSSLEIVADIRQIIENCEIYNRPGAPERIAGENLAKLLDRRLEEIRLGTNSNCVTNNNSLTNGRT